MLQIFLAPFSMMQSYRQTVVGDSASIPVWVSGLYLTM